MAKSELKLSARHIELYDEDWVFLNDHFGRGSASPIGASRLIRDIVHQKVKALREHHARKLDELATGAKR